MQKQKNLVLLHGPANVASRSYLANFKTKFVSVDIVVFEKGANVEDIKTSLQSISFLSAERLIVIENPSESFSIEGLVDSSVTAIIWFDHEIKKEKQILQYIQENGEVVYFSESKEVTVFSFLDLLGAKNNKAFVELQRLKKAGFDTVYLITMILYLLRSLSVEKGNAPRFVQEKIERQKKNFSQAEIIRLYEQVLCLDYKVKTGEIEKDQAEFSLVSEFMK